MSVALLVPVCSRGQSYGSIDETPLVKQLVPSILETILPNELSTYQMAMFVGVDDDDAFYLDHIQDLESRFRTFPGNVRICILKDCAHNPVRAWNRLFESAYLSGNDYFFQVGDDVVLDTTGWLSLFIHTLEQQGNFGTIAPCEMNNYWGRKMAGQHIVHENNFVHRQHFEIFGYFFYPAIRNWHCDDWITLVYDELATMRMEVRCRNLVQGNRYQIQPCTEIESYVKEGKRILLRFAQRHLNTK